MKTDIPVIIITGPTCSGKTEVFDYLCENGYVGIDMGDFLRKLLQLNTTSREETIHIIGEEIERYGRERITSQMVEKLISMHLPNTKGFVVCGMRSSKDMKIFIEKLKNKTINIFIYSDPSDCYKRNIQRIREGDPRTFWDFLKNYYEEINSGIGDLIKNFEFELVINNSNLDDLYFAINALINKRSYYNE
jgi:dephospho-CoA kinase